MSSSPLRTSLRSSADDTRATVRRRCIEPVRCRAANDGFPAPHQTICAKLRKTFGVSTPPRTHHATASRSVPTRSRHVVVDAEHAFRIDRVGREMASPRTSYTPRRHAEDVGDGNSERRKRHRPRMAAGGGCRTRWSRTGCVSPARRGRLSARRPRSARRSRPG